jgi:hypothetical protein
MNVRVLKHIVKDDRERIKKLAAGSKDVIDAVIKALEEEKQAKLDSILSHSYSKDTSIYLSGIVGEMKAYEDSLSLLKSLGE